MANPSTEPRIIACLSQLGRISPESLNAARAEISRRSDVAPERALIGAKIVTEEEVARSYADLLRLPMIDPTIDPPPLELNLDQFVSEGVCSSHSFVPWRRDEDVLEVAFASIEHFDQIGLLRFSSGHMIRPIVATYSTIDKRIDALFNSGSEIVSGPRGFGGDEDGDSTEVDSDILDLEAPPPQDKGGRIVRMANQILEQALKTGASDIHLEPFEESCKIRLRIDGVLHELPSPSKSVYTMVIARFKILAKMDIAEKRIPQDGAIAVKAGERRIDLRVNTVPTVHGEKMVMRILDKGAIPLDLTKLGLDDRQVTDLVESIQMPHGLALVTGPTGSGKSTTLYSCLNLLNEPSTNICTVEDPVEYKFKGMNQIQVKSQVGLTFASSLRAFLRQDPDIIMVGEVRDQETAEICLRAALTGHFVLSTIHTNDALSAVNRLIDMGIEPFLLATSLRVLEAQRLARRLCKHCKQPVEIDDEVAKTSGMKPGEQIYQPNGCPRCRRVGFKGRVGVFEVIRITSHMSQLIQRRTPLPELRQAAREEGMKLLFDSAIDKVREGLTSLEVALSLTMSEEE